MSTISKLGRDKSGQVAILFALSIIPIVAVAGFAIDFQQTVKRKAKVQLVMDSAVLAAARVKQTGASNDEIKLTVQQFMDAQIGNLGGLDCDPTTVLVTENSEEIDASILCEQTTALIKVVGRDEMPFRVSSASEYGIDKVDVAFMFDVSGSMNSSNRLVNLKAAAKEAIDVLLPAGAPSELIEDTRLAMVSYNSMVNAGDFFPEVAGVPATRTYEHTIQPIFTEDDLTEGSLFDEMHIGLYDTDTGNLISEIGDGAKAQAGVAGDLGDANLVELQILRCRSVPVVPQLILFHDETDGRQVAAVGGGVSQHDDLPERRRDAHVGVVLVVLRIDRPGQYAQPRRHAARRL